MNNPKNHETNNAEHGSFHGVKTDAKVLKITGWLTGIYLFVLPLLAARRRQKTASKVLQR